LFHPVTPDPESPPTPKASTSTEKEVNPDNSTPVLPSLSESGSSFLISQNLTPVPESSKHIMSTDPPPLGSNLPSGSTFLNSNSLCLCTKKLNDTNFAAWRYNMLNALAYMGLGKFIKEHTPELQACPDYEEQLVQVTTYIRLHLGCEDSTCFVNNLDNYNPKGLWDSIVEYHAAKTVENAANVMEKLYDVFFVEGDMQKIISTF
jgi:hypothetical protein